MIDPKNITVEEIEKVFTEIFSKPQPQERKVKAYFISGVAVDDVFTYYMIHGEEATLEKYPYAKLAIDALKNAITEEFKRYG